MRPFHLLTVIAILCTLAIQAGDVKAPETLRDKLAARVEGVKKHYEPNKIYVKLMIIAACLSAYLVLLTTGLLQPAILADPQATLTEKAVFATVTLPSCIAVAAGMVVLCIVGAVQILKGLVNFVRDRSSHFLEIVILFAVLFILFHAVDIILEKAFAGQTGFLARLQRKGVTGMVTDAWNRPANIVLQSLAPVLKPLLKGTAFFGWLMAAINKMWSKKWPFWSALIMAVSLLGYLLITWHTVSI